MTRKHVNTGACFQYQDQLFMIELAPENPATGKIYCVNENAGAAVELGTFVWGLDPKLYITTVVLGYPVTVAIWKRQCKYIGML